LHRKQCYIFQPQAAPHTQFYTWTNKNKEKKTNIQEKHKNKTKQKKRKKNKIINNTNTRNLYCVFIGDPFINYINMKIKNKHTKWSHINLAPDRISSPCEFVLAIK
jgi:hypothetical protein